jgi:hypothetical protein
MKRAAVLNVVGLTGALIGPATPRISSFLARGAKANILPAFPAVTCTAQSTYLTGATPAQHGIVSNGWYDRELAEVQFWKQSNHLVRGRKIWEELRELQPGFTCAKLFWWYNMYSSADYSITPRPMYPADGRKLFDIYSWPYSIRTDIKKELGEFPFATFWGPAAGVKSPQGEPDAASRWIAESAKWIEKKYAPSLSLVYLPHLDYNLQRLGPKHPAIAEDLRRIDAIVGGLIDFFLWRVRCRSFCFRNTASRRWILPFISIEFSANTACLPSRRNSTARYSIVAPAAHSLWQTIKWPTFTLTTQPSPKRFAKLCRMTPKFWTEGNSQSWALTIHARAI